MRPREVQEPERVESYALLLWGFVRGSVYQLRTPDY